MSKILSRNECNELIMKYYIEHWGEQAGDLWQDSTVANVRTFLREGQYITLKCHMLTGKIEEFIEQEVASE